MLIITNVVTFKGKTENTQERPIILEVRLNEEDARINWMDFSGCQINSSAYDEAQDYV